MRLIDADALKSDVIWHSAFIGLLGGNIAEFAELIKKVFLEEIAKAPTIDATTVSSGEWINLCGNQYKCSECGSTWVFGGIPKANYCADCGAKMDGGKDDDLP